MAAPKAYDWWRVAFHRPYYDGRLKWADKRQEWHCDVHNGLYGLVCSSMPELLYPTQRDLPTHRREIDLYPESKNPQR